MLRLTIWAPQGTDALKIFSKQDKVLADLGSRNDFDISLGTPLEKGGKQSFPYCVMESASRLIFVY